MGIRSPHHFVLAMLLAAILLIAACAPTTAPTATVTATIPPAPTATMRPATTTSAHEAPVFPTSAVEYPANYRTDFLHYLTVDRPDGFIRDVYIDPIAIDGLLRARRLPDGTTVVLETWRAQVDANGDPVKDADGRYIKDAPLAMVHVGQKRGDWAESDFPSAARSGDWNFGSFDFQTGAKFNEDLSACFNCHQAAANRDFLYSAPQLAQFAASDVTQYFFCELRRRTPCQ